MLHAYKYIRFTKEEQLKALNHVYLVKDGVYYGEFDAEYIVPDLGKMCGWWKPSLDSAEALTDNWIIINPEKEYWTEIYYLTSPNGEIIERIFIKNQDLEEGGALILELGSWDIYMPDEVNDQKGGF